MATSEAGLSSAKSLSRRAYEFGRIRVALLALIWIVPLTSASIMFCGRPNFSLALGLVLAVMSVLFFWRGEMFGRGALLGALVGTIAAMLPIVSHTVGLCCVYDLEFGLCVGSGVLAGFLVSTRALKIKRNQAQYLTASGVVVTLSGALGCAVLGMTGLWGFVLGAVVVSAPLFVVAHLKPGH